MTIGIIGADRIGANAARLFVEVGHRVAICNSRGPDSLESLVAEIGPECSLCSSGTRTHSGRDTHKQTESKGAAT
jgi:predicted dinucleotide-binding enzyme